MGDDQDDSTDERPYRTDGSGGPTKTELGMQIARLEETVQAQNNLLNHLTDQLDTQIEQNSERLDTYEDQTDRLWMIYQGTKWVMALMASAGLFTLLFQLAV